MRFSDVVECVQQSIGARRALLIFCTDHGGSETEHKHMLHSHMTVPLGLFCVSSREEPIASPLSHVRERPPGPISVIDITPTVCRALDIHVPRYCRGVSLL